MAILLDGKATAREVRAGVKEGAAEFLARTGRPPGLAVVLVGEDPASVIYTRNKAKMAKKCGMHDVLHKLPAETTENELLRLIDELNRDDRIDGMLVQLPLPKAIDPQEVVGAIDPVKDADGFHPVNVGKLSLGQDAPVPCTPRGVMTLLERYDIDPKGMDAVVLGRSNIVGKPMSVLLTAAHATVTVCHSRTRDLAGHARRADLLISAMGRPRMITADHVREGVVAIDVGINRLDDGSLVGDLDYEPVFEKARAVTPVPGGVGPMTIATLLRNVLDLAERRAGVV
jgi:methylenetetrahydrofolate dehydrogenase (NADP+)/methenyltetrahydrofolate cyclohydrolase